MSYQLKGYSSVNELLSHVTTEMEQTRSQLYKAVEASHDVRKRNERARKLTHVLFNGSKPPTPSRGVRVGDLDVVVNASADDEMLALDLMARTQNERLSALLKIRDILIQMQKRGPQEYLGQISCLVIENDGVPRKIMFQEHGFQSPALASLVYGGQVQLTGVVGPHPEESKLGDVQLAMASIVDESTSRPTVTPEVEPVVSREEAVASATGSQRPLSNLVQFLTARPVHN